MNEQVIEVDYNEELVEDYKRNYIMEEEGIGAEIGEIYDPQTELNTDPIEDLLDLDEVVIDSFEEIAEGGEE